MPAVPVEKVVFIYLFIYLFSSRLLFIKKKSHVASVVAAQLRQTDSIKNENQSRKNIF